MVLNLRIFQYSFFWHMITSQPSSIIYSRTCHCFFGNLRWNKNPTPRNLWGRFLRELFNLSLFANQKPCFLRWKKTYQPIQPKWDDSPAICGFGSLSPQHRVKSNGATVATTMDHRFLGGGCTNPSEKYARRIGSISWWKYVRNHHLVLNI